MSATALEADIQRAYGARQVLSELYERLAIASSLGTVDSTKICESGLFAVLEDLWDETGAKYCAASWLQSRGGQFDAAEPVTSLTAEEVTA